MQFDQLNLHPAILQAIAQKGYTTPTPVQSQAIPAVLQGRDVMAAAQTGTGKTAAFTLPLLTLLSQQQQPVTANHVRVLIVTPTRELAAQIQDNIETYSAGLGLRSLVVYGGVKINPQMMKLRRGVDILVATPGRLLDLYGQNAVRLNSVECLVLDEADRMLDMGFIRDIRKITALLPKNRQNLLFSATFSSEIRALAKTLVKNPIEISIEPNKAAHKVQQIMHPVDKKNKRNLLLHLISEHRWQQVLVFVKTKHGANKLTHFLEEYGVRTAAIHGNKSQGARNKALANFKDGEIRVLVATDIAARGLDIHQLPQVVNFDLPQVAEDYVHRIGRTGRAGASGYACSLVAADEANLLFDIERLLQQHLPREYVQGFVPDHEVPTSKPIQPRKKPRPKKNKTANASQAHSHHQKKRPQPKGGRTTGTSKDSRSSKPRRSLSKRP